MIGNSGLMPRGTNGLAGNSRAIILGCVPYSEAAFVALHRVEKTHISPTFYW